MDFDNSEIDKSLEDLDKCGDKHCGNIITIKEMKEEELKFLNLIKKKCRSKSEKDS
jgi:hypothetical protein